MLREIVLDTETTGLDPYAGHRVVEIGCVELINHIRTSNHFHIYLNPERDMPREAEQIHGLSSEFLADKPKFAQIAPAFIEFLQDSPLIIHNASFDLKFLNWELEQLHMDRIEFSRAIDTVLMARQRFPGQPANLDALCKRFDIDLSARTKHGALLDAELLADVYLELRGGRQSKLVLDELSAPLPLRNAEVLLTNYEYRSFAVSEDELARHHAMLKTLKNAMWLE